MMKYTTVIDTPLGAMRALAEEEPDGEAALAGLWFVGGKYAAQALQSWLESPEAFTETRLWLEAYFAGREPERAPRLKAHGSSFQMAVWDLLLKIPYGKTETYGALSTRIAALRGVNRMSAQAIGGAVGHNPISILIPCHRVIGSDGSLTGYAGGLDKKRFLLELEGTRI
jgi:methylated-DNA-[protein]-cysteine S-methyltransferase